MTDEFKKVVDQIAELSAEMDRQRKQDQNEIKKLGDISTETRNKWESMNEKMSDLEDIKEEVENVKTILNRVKDLGEQAGEKTDKSEEYHKQVESYIRKGQAFNAQDYLDVEEVKLLATDSNPDGGYWIDPDRSGRTVTIEYATSPIRAVAAQANTASPFLQGIYDGDEPESQVEGERGPSNENATPEIGMWTINTHIYSTNLPATSSMLEDAEFNVEAWINEKASRKLMRDENRDSVRGSGVNAWRGFTTYPDGSPVSDIQPRGTIQQTASSVSGSFNINDWLKQEELVKSEYLDSNATYGAHRRTVGILRRLVDADGRPLWEPSLQAGQPAVFNGYRVVKMDDMDAPNAGVDTFDVGKLPVVFGNFNRGYQIVDRRGIRVLRNPYKEPPKIIFYINKRSGGDVVNFDCLKLLRIAA